MLLGRARRSIRFTCKCLDERFLDEREDLPQEELWKTRVQLLIDEERAGMDPPVNIKMEESKSRVLVN